MRCCIIEKPTKDIATGNFSVLLLDTQSLVLVLAAICLGTDLSLDTLEF